MISQEAIQRILGIEDRVHLAAGDMAKQFVVTFYSDDSRASSAVKSFVEKFKTSLTNLGVQIVPLDSVWENVPTKKRITRFFKYLMNDIFWVIRKLLNLPEIGFFLSPKTLLKLSGGKRIKKRVCIVCIGEQESNMLPMQYIVSFKTNSIITIVDFPNGIDESSNFSQHFDTAMSLFAYHMTNIVIAVDKSKWMVYNFNASHPIYRIDDIEFDNKILNSIIPKIAAPISPHKLNEFIITDDRFDPYDIKHEYIIKEMRQGGSAFENTGLYPKGKNIDKLPFRHNFHRLIGKMHLDDRSGMSFGFIAFQMPTNVFHVKTKNEFVKKYPEAFLESDYFTDKLSNIVYLLMRINSDEIVIKIPDVWVMTLRSGSDKTHFNPKTDLLKIGLVNGKMRMQFPKNLKIDRNYKPSFDTKVILAHAVGNAIIAQIAKYFGKYESFIKSIEDKGIAISHWHGYFNNKKLPKEIMMYGRDNPHVSCSSPQSAIYALQGKLKAFSDRISAMNDADYIGDIHIEPHHGINISYPSLIDLANYIQANQDITELGNKYL